MPSQREIRRRIGSVRNIKQITRAMQFVAASKLKRAQDATLQSRPYSDKLDEVLADAAAVLDAEDHPLLAAAREGGSRLLVLFTTDRGLAGSLNTNTIRFAAREIADVDRRPDRRDRRPQGHRRDAPRAGAHRGRVRRVRRPAHVRGDPAARPPHLGRLPRRHVQRGGPHPPGLRLDARPAARDATGCCPIEPNDDDDEGIPGRQFIFEPDAATVLSQLLPRYVATRLFQAVLELTASEQSARMVAMRNATDNAQELIDDLTLTYNKVRQANITREMIEIATGASSA